MILFALSIMMLMVVVAGTLDYLTLGYHKNKLQNGVDASAIAAAREFKLSNTFNATPAEITAKLTDVAKIVLQSNIKKSGSLSNIAVKVDIENRKVTVDATMKDVDSPFGNFLSPKKTLQASATAQTMGETPLCALAMGEDVKGSLVLNASAQLTGKKCAVYSNSAKENSISALDGALIEAGVICSAGGFSGGKIHFEPDPVTDCPKLDDPLSARPEPFVGGCDYNNKVLGTAIQGKKEKINGSVKNGKEAITEAGSTDSNSGNTTVTLNPGVYCGGLKIMSGVNVWLRPGVYIMKDGPLDVIGNASLSGEYVGFYFKGLKSVFFFGQNTSISLTAPRDGIMSSILFFEARGEKEKRRFAIFSDDARVLLGTIYLPQGDLYVDGYRPVADLSAYTVVIANRISMFNGPHLVLNTDYSATDIPVPDGILDTNNTTRLTN